MNTKLYIHSLERTSVNPCHRPTLPRYGNCLIAALALGAATSAFGAVGVPEGSDLTPILYNSTASGLREFELLGDVETRTAYYLNTVPRYNISIDGKGHTITKGASDYAFFITGMQGASLTIRNANITSRNTNNSYGMIVVDANSRDATIDLSGTRIYGSQATQGWYAGALTTYAQNTVVKGDVTFEANYGSANAGGAVATGYNTGNPSLVFEGKTNFVNNHATTSGGAVLILPRSTVTFKENATFTGNHANADFGGAIQAWAGSGGITFEKNAAFTNNYVKNSGTRPAGVRGGAINIGNSPSNNSPQLKMNGTSEFTGNYVWGAGNTVAIGGALSLSAAEGDPMNNQAIDINHIYGATIGKGIFKDNYAYSDVGDGYGGAIFSKARESTLTFGSGSKFIGNAATTLGGAIYFDQGTINLNGNIEFSGNRHGATFSTASGRPVLNAGSGSANAIYFSVGNQAVTATLNLNTGAGEVIHFADPIESAAGKMVTINKTGSGTALFTGHDSDILAKTLVSAGTFELGDGVAYGRVGTPATSSFHLAAGATLKGGADATLRASSIRLDGRLEVQNGEFTFEGSNVALSSTSVVALTIDDIANYAFINMGGNALAINNASLEITATNYVPSQEISDTFTLVSNLSAQASGMFLQGESITINGAEFTIHYNANTITLQQMTVPEPSTYALILAAGMASVVWVRRQRKLRATVA